MNYKNYQNSRNAVWKILIEQHVYELPIRVSELCGDMGIDIMLYTPTVNDTDGKSIIINDSPLILVSDQCALPRRRFTAAHELGHIILGHVGKYELVNREPSTGDSLIEQEANIFASRLLAPAIVLRDLNVRSAADIAQLCNISLQAAEFRWQRLKILYEREQRFKRLYGYSCFGLHPLEREVRKQFDKYITHHRL